MTSYDAILIVSFGGPEKREDVMPFLENVLRGKRVPRERMLEVAEHYYHFEGRSPINEQVHELASALEDLLKRKGPSMPVYVGNRNWHPMLADTLRRMAGDGVKRALAFFTSAFSSYSGCRQYLENIEVARAEVANAPEVERLRGFYNHPGFLEPMAASVKAALADLPDAEVVFTAHSIPITMAQTSRYVEELNEACRIVGELSGLPRWRLVYQSRSGPPSQPWLEPDISDTLRAIAPECAGVVVVPIGFLSDHLEVLWDLDEEAAAVARELNLPMRRAATVGAHPRFVEMIRELILERIQPGQPKLALGSGMICPDVCASDCCPAPPTSSPQPPSGR
jgi:ferrochelatase